MVVFLCVFMTPISAAPTLYGPSGLITVPTAEALRFRELNIGVDYFMKDMDQQDLDQVYYKLNLGTFQNCELGLVGGTVPEEGVFVNVKYFADVIGFIDMDKVLFNYKEAKAIQEEIIKSREDYQKNFMEGEEKILKAKEKNTSDSEIKKLVEELENDLRPQQEAIIRKETEMQRGLLEKVVESSESVAKNYGIDVILDKRVVLVGGFDLTDYVIRKLNK